MNRLKGFSVTYERIDTDGELNDDDGFIIKNVSLSEALYEIEKNVKQLNVYHTTFNGFGLLRSICFNNWNDGTPDFYENGVRENRTLHIDQHVTYSSVKRICKLLGC